MAKIKRKNTSGKPINIVNKMDRIEAKNQEMLRKMPGFMNSYYSHMSLKGLSVRTKNAYLTDLMHFLEYLVTDFPAHEKNIKKITTEDINALKAKDINSYLIYCQKYEKEYTLPSQEIEYIVYNNNQRSLSRKKSSITSLLKFLYSEDLIENDITSKITPIITPKKSAKSVKALSDDEIERLLYIVSTGNGLTDKQKVYWEKTKYRDRAILYYFVNAGLRLSELQQLNVSSFNFNRMEYGELTIYRKRDKESVIILTKSLRQVIDEYIEIERPGYLRKADDEDALFLSIQGTRLKETQIRDLVKKYTAIVLGTSVSAAYSPHKLRASAATSAIRRGNPINKVASLLDHDNIQTTMIYVQEGKYDKKEVLDSMDRDL